jgi:hypothetical protein
MLINTYACWMELGIVVRATSVDLELTTLADSSCFFRSHLHLVHALTGMVFRSLSFSLYCAGRQMGQYQQQSD